MGDVITRRFLRGRQFAAFALLAATLAFAALGSLRDVKDYRSGTQERQAAVIYHAKIGEVLAAIALFTVAPAMEAERHRAALVPKLDQMLAEAPRIEGFVRGSCGPATPDTAACRTAAVKAQSLRADVETFLTLAQDLTASHDMRVGPGAPRLQVMLQLAHEVLLPKFAALTAESRQAQSAQWSAMMSGAIWRSALVCAVAAAAAVLLLIPMERRILAAQAAQEREKRRAQEAERSKGAFLANMSHEIRTALNGVIGVAALLGRTRLDREQGEYLRIMEASGGSLMRLINDILDYSKLGAGELSVEVARFDPRRAIVEVAQLAAPLAASKGVALTLDMDPDLPRQATGDGVRLRQIVTNLVQNAIKFTAAGSVDVIVEWRAQTRVMVVKVRDTGVGIPADKLETVFQAFQQVDNTLTPRHHGAGLGLAIARMLAERMGGRLSVASIVGQGSCFTVETPLGPAPEAAQAISLTGRRVALAAGGEALARALSAAGAEVSDLGSAASSADAIVFGPPTPPADPDDARAPDAIAESLSHAAAIWRALAPGARLVALTPPGLSVSGVDVALPTPVDPDALVAAVHGDGPARSDARRPTPGAGLRVLVADDNPVNRMIAERLLQALGAEVEAVEDGRAAVAATARRAFDLVLMDVTMPVMNGLQATGEIRRREAGAGRRTPIVALTAHALDEHRERCVEAGMDDHLGKPFRTEELAALLTRWAPSGEHAAPARARRAGTASRRD